MSVSQAKSRAGRPTKLTAELQDKVCEAIRAGNYVETAAAFAGISKNTLYDWLKRGAREPKGRFRDFSEAVEKAQADAEARDVALIARAAAEGVWQAAAWRLERKFPDRWGRRDRHQVEATLNAKVSEVTPDDAVEELARLLAAGAAGAGTPKAP